MQQRGERLESEREMEATWTAAITLDPSPMTLTGAAQRTTWIPASPLSAARLPNVMDQAIHPRCSFFSRHSNNIDLHLSLDLDLIFSSLCLSLDLNNGVAGSK
jgi:hypothetical protein